jgi:carbamoyl-phosphate synthase large subunit
VGKREDIKKILVIGSGPIVIGQAAEFDYAGTQACLALKEEGYEVVLVNSNPATIMTDTQMADRVYMEPLTLEYVAKIIRYERPDALLASFGGQTALNLALQLDQKGVLDECQVEIIGTDLEAIRQAEDRELFRELCEKIGEPILPSHVAYTVDEALAIAEEITYPIILRPAFTLGGTGGGFADTPEELKVLAHQALELSPVHQVLIEKSIKGFKEIEFEVIRSGNDTALTVCAMENVDPVGVHTGDSIVVAPTLTLSDEAVTMLHDSAIRLIRALNIKGGCNVQFALDPNSLDYYLIEVNPRLSRSSALASKASAYPIARVAAKIAVGLNLEEILVAGQPASFEPQLDYIVAKLPRFAFDKFEGADKALSTQMKATGEVMSLGRDFGEALLKGVRSLEVGASYLHLPRFDHWEEKDLLDYVETPTDDRIFAIAALFRLGVTVEAIHERTAITAYFLEEIKKLVDNEKLIEEADLDEAKLRELKTLDYSDAFIAKKLGKKVEDIIRLRQNYGIFPAYDRVDTAETTFPEPVPYFYSTYKRSAGDLLEEAHPESKGRVLVLGSGPIRIGQGVEFDYSTVHAVQTLQAMGYEAILINNNPETVSTDYTTADRLYFEPLTLEDVMNVIEREKPLGVIVSLGGQTAINLSQGLTDLGIALIGTDNNAIERAEDRDRFEQVMQELGIPQPKGQAVYSIESGVAVARKIGYPVLVRPSFVLGGRAMEIVNSEEAIRHYLQTAVEIDEDKPVLVDKYIRGTEVEVDAICDGQDVFMPGIMQHIEKTGIHSGDSISVFPAFGLSDEVRIKIIGYTVKLGLGLGIKGLYNIQYIVDPHDEVYVIEVNPRSSRTVPFLSKASGYALADMATRVMLGQSLRDQGIGLVCPSQPKRWYVKAPAFSFGKLHGADAYLSPEMKSTGEAIGYDKSLNRALYKALQASGMKVSNYGTIFVTVADSDKERALPLVRRFYELGFNIEATSGTAAFLKENGIKTRVKAKISEGSNEILEALRQGYVSYVINTRDPAKDHNAQSTDGALIRQTAVENNVTIFTALETVEVLLDVLEEITIGISTIDEKKED